MGCISSTGNEPREKGKVIFIHGYPCAGKTFYMDYLHSIGWEIVDGDEPLYSKSNKVAKDFYNAVNAIYKIQKGEPCEEKDRKYLTNHYSDLAKKAKKLQDRGKNVCISVLASLAQMRAEIPKVVPDVTFILLEVDIPVLVERNFKRMQVAGEAMGMSLEEQW